MVEAVKHKVEHQAVAPEEREESAGEKIFDRTVYTGIGFGVNEGLSLWITDQFVFGKNLLKGIPGLEKAGEAFSKKGFDGASEAIAKRFKIVEKIGKDGKIVLPHKTAGNSLLMVTLLAGGTALILPMKQLEDHEAYWAKKANHLVDRFGSENLTDEQIEARDKEVDAYIASTPKQSWPSLLAGRVVACAASVTTGTIIGSERNDKLMDFSERTFAGSIQKEGHKQMKNRYARLLSVETYSCAISSYVLELSSKFFAKHAAAQQVKEAAEQKPASDEVLASTGGGTDEEAHMTGDCANGHHAEKITAERQHAADVDEKVQPAGFEKSDSHSTAIQAQKDQAAEGSYSLQA